MSARPVLQSVLGSALSPALGEGVGGGGASAPAQFGAGDWSVTDRQLAFDARIAISALPDDGGDAITDLEYQVDSGSWVSLGGTGTGNYDITGLTYNVEADIAIRAVNGVGNATASATKAVTPTYNPEVALPTKLIAWWTADDAASLTLVSTDHVSSWADQVAGYASVQTTDSNRPIYSATSFNGAPGLSFNGTSQNFICTTAGLMALLPDGAEVGEIWAIVSQDALAADATTRIVAAHGTGSINTARRLGRSVSTSNRARLGVGSGGANTPVVDLATDLSGRNVIRGVIGATDSAAYANDDAGASAAVVPATVTATRFRIGANEGGAAEFWQGQVRDILVTAGALTTDEAAALWAWALPRRAL